MRKRKSGGGGGATGEKKKESAVSIQGFSRRKRQKDAPDSSNTNNTNNNNNNNNQSQMPATAASAPVGPVTIPFDDGTTTAYGGIPAATAAKPRGQKSEFVAVSTRKQKMKKKIKDLKKQQQQQQNENPEVQESEYKPSDKSPSTRIQKRKKPSKGKKNLLGGGGGEDSKKEKKQQQQQDSPSRRIKRKPQKMCSDELCISSDLHNKPEENGNGNIGVVDEKSVLEKSSTFDGRPEWVQSCYVKRVKGIVKEFSKAKDYFPVTTFNVCNSNENKNRYADVLCADETRVILKNRRPNNDYIHASWLVAPTFGAQRYICAQGPMEESTIDFWQMICQEKITVIVMLCGIIENGFEKCSQYWPAGCGDVIKHGKFKLKNEKIETIDIDTIKCTTIKIENLKPQTGEDPTFTVLHYQWAEWPDHVSPAEPGPATELLKVVKEKAKGAPIVVHCSAGIGRTGTFCGIDYANDRLRTDAKVKMPEILHEMRRQRVHSVQSNPQYVYIHLCLIHHLIDTKVVAETEDTKQFFTDYKKYMDAVKQKVGKHSRNRQREKVKEAAATASATAAAAAAEKEKEKEGGGSE